MAFCSWYSHKTFFLLIAISIPSNSENSEKIKMTQETREHQSEKERYMNAKKYFEIGQNSFLEKRFEEAIEHFKNGIQELGMCYLDPDAIDETGMSIIAAKIREKEKRYDYAAKILQDVLGSRLKSYVKLKSQKKC